MISPFIGVMISSNRGNSGYFLEILNQQGYFFELITPKIAGDQLGSKNILIIYAPFKIEKHLKRILQKFVHNGGSLIFAGDVVGAEDLTGTQRILSGEKQFGFPVGGVTERSVGEGYLSMTNRKLQSNLPDSWFPLHGFGCSPLELKKAETLAEYSPNTNPSKIYPAITLRRIGRGVVVHFAPMLAHTVRRIQEGLYIEHDGIPPGDGMAPINDGILKAEDGLVLDWVKDRRPVSPKYKIPAFLIPVADVWKKLFSNVIDLCADLTNTAISKVDYWPGGAEFVLQISHDTDGNNEKLALEMLKKVNNMGIKTTWCLIPPGYSPEMCQLIQSHGHELAFHFDVQSIQGPGNFSREMLKEQLEETYEHTGIDQFLSNKNHYTRWEGRVEFFKWLAENGFLSDQSKGPSKAGTTGFPFGSAHPWFPMDNEGNLINCVEVSFQCQDLGMQGPDDIGPDLLYAVKAIRGVFHLIFHPAHIKNRPVQKRFTEIVNLGTKLGGRFMRNVDIVRWCLARREYIENKGSSPLEGTVIKIRKNGDWQ